MTKRFTAFAACLLLVGCAMGRPIQVATISDRGVLSDAAPFEVTLSNFNFMPEPIRLRAGQAYRLTIVNTAHGGHDFTAPEFFEAARIASADAGKVAQGRIMVAGGQRVTVTLVPTAGTYKLTCTHFGHALLGMTGHIIVT